MPTKKATNNRTRKKQVKDHVAQLLCPKRDPIPPTLAMYDRIDELARLTRDELPCSLCDGVGLPKIEGTNMRVCVVCRDALRDVPRTERKALIGDHDSFMLHRMPYFAAYLVSNNRLHPDTTMLDKTA